MAPGSLWHQPAASACRLSSLHRRRDSELGRLQRRRRDGGVIDIRGPEESRICVGVNRLDEHLIHAERRRSAGEGVDPEVQNQYHLTGRSHSFDRGYDRQSAHVRAMRRRNQQPVAHRINCSAISGLVAVISRPSGIFGKFCQSPLGQRLPVSIITHRRLCTASSRPLSGSVASICCRLANSVPPGSKGPRRRRFTAAVQSVGKVNAPSRGASSFCRSPSRDREWDQVPSLGLVHTSSPTRLRSPSGLPGTVILRRFGVRSEWSNVQRRISSRAMCGATTGLLSTCLSLSGETGDLPRLRLASPRGGRLR